MFSNRRWVLPMALAIVCLLTAPLAQAGGWSKTIAASDKSRVEILLRSGSVRAVGWDRAKLKVETTESSGPTIAAKGNSVRIPGDEESASFDGNLVVYLPRNAMLRVSTMAGKISAQKLNGYLRLTSISEDVSATDCKGPVVATSVSGSVVVKRVGTKVELRSVSGAINAETITGEQLEAKTVSGTLRLRGVGVRSLSVKTLSGELDVDLSVMPAEGASVKTFSGEAKIRLPSGSGFEIDANSGSGSVTIGFPLPKGAQEGNEVRAKIGAGGPELRLRSFSGSIRVIPAR